jgi:hypothetical protein
MISSALARARGCTILLGLMVLLPAGTNAQVMRFPDCIFFPTMFVPFDMTLTYDGPQGITGANVRITGFPAEWLVTFAPPIGTDNCLTCDLLGEGANLTFPSCTNLTVQLFQITVVPLTVATNLVIAPEKTLDSPIDCPSVILCDAPVFTVECVGCDRAYINHDNAVCPVPVEQITWSQVRSMYR